MQIGKVKRNQDLSLLIHKACRQDLLTTPDRFRHGSRSVTQGLRQGSRHARLEAPPTGAARVLDRLLLGNRGLLPMADGAVHKGPQAPGFGELGMRTALLEGPDESSCLSLNLFGPAADIALRMVADQQTGGRCLCERP